MSFFKNRTVIGVICIVLSLLICFAITPLFNQSISQKTEIVRVITPIKIGEAITKDMVQVVEVGGYNLPEDVIRQTDTVIGKFASADLAPGDYIIASKIADAPAAENAYLYNLTGEKQAISVSVKSFAAGLSGKLISGDIVSIVAPDYKKQGVTVIPPELQYVEVIAVTAGSGYDANTGEQKEAEAEDEKELPAPLRCWSRRSRAKSLPSWKRTVPFMCPSFTVAARKMRQSLPRRRIRCFPSCIRRNRNLRKARIALNRNPLRIHRQKAGLSKC